MTGSAEALGVSRTVILGAAFTLREARRTGNQTELVAELRCECARPDCRAVLPAVAGAYRGTPERFIVTPDHCDGETVVAAADRFFVVDPALPALAGGGSE